MLASGCGAGWRSCLALVRKSSLSGIHLETALSTLWLRADKASFTRPLGLYGSYGLAARKAFRENGNANRVSSEMPLPEEHRKIGMTPICPKAGDMMIMPEAMTHGVPSLA